MFSWVKIILLGLQLFDGVFKWLHDQGKIQEGEDRAILRSLKLMASRSQRAKEIDEEYEKKTEAEVKKSLEGDFRD